MNKLTVLPLLMSLIVNSVAADTWIEPTTVCKEGVATGLECVGDFCSQINLDCNSSYQMVEAGQWTEYISEEANDGTMATCPSGTYMVGTQCSGQHCDRVRMLCKAIKTSPHYTVSVNNCTDTDVISEEQNNPWSSDSGEDQVVTAMKCVDEGEFCDNKKLTACDIQISASSRDSGFICENKYALCTSAPCIPDPLDPDGQAICNCNVQKGPNFGASTCDERQPEEIAGTVKVLSTYSFQEAAVRQVMKCDGDPLGPWTDCLDAKCIVDPRDPGKAICTCPYGDENEEQYVTYGGGCDTDTCTTGYWSAATTMAFTVGSDALLKYFDLQPENPPYSYCPAE